jgi:FkbH-like protein
VYEFDWARRSAWEREGLALGVGESRLSRQRVARTSLLHWQEHCVECAAPECYRSCALFDARPDGDCRRFSYGIAPNPAFRGLLDHGADLHFRRWGKLQSWLHGRSATPALHRWLDSADRALSRATQAAARLAPGGAGRRLRRAAAGVRRRLHPRLLRRAPRRPYDAFVLECYSPEKAPFRLILEVVREDEVLFRHAFPIAPGWNLHSLPVAELRIGDDWSSGRLAVYPDEDRECRLIFTWLDLVVFSEGCSASGSAAVQRAGHVKCVAWDLDQTLWSGILAESAPEELVLRAEAVDLIRALDERGILQTIVSKNDHALAWSVVERFDLAEYFLHPAIGWGPKIESLRRVAQRLNLGLDSFALIDDSDFERAEVASALPQVRSYPETGLAALLAYPEFDVPITQMSRQRRAAYRTNAEREQAEVGFRGDYEDFLRTCRMQLRLFVPREPEDVERCLELIQRSNQLNLSSRRYTRTELDALLRNPECLCVAIHCQDRFGDYGIVGFASVAETDVVPLLRDFVLSCRVAQKRVEHSFLQWLVDRERGRGGKRVRAQVVCTERNGPLRRAFEEVFECLEDLGGEKLLELDVSRPVQALPVMELKDEVGCPR